jgi:aspartyl-tRNA(Asn)/glutamyl-tRNA(Gln) amidotransferase subunit C
VSVSEPPEHGPGDDKVTSGAGHLSREDVAHLAHLARLEVTDDELDRYAGQLDVILTSVAVVSEVVAGGGVATKWQPPGSGDPSEQSGTVSRVASDDIEPTSHAVPLVNVFREDVPQPGLTRDQALAMAPSAEAGRFRVPQILGEEQ